MMNQWQGCGRLDCKNCAESVGRQRAGRVWDAISDLANAMAWVVPTTPPCARGEVAEMGASKFKRLAAETVQEWFASMGYAGTGCVSFVHPVGSVYVCDACKVRTKKNDDAAMRCTSCKKTMRAEDDTEWHPHGNVGTPLVDVTGNGVQLIRAKRTPAELESLRVLWRKKLSEAVGFDVGVANIHYSFRIGARKMRHALRYFARSFPGWKRWTTNAGGNRYGTIGNRSLTATRKAIAESSVGLTVHPVQVMQCAQCGKEVHLSGITGVMAYNALGPVGAHHLSVLSGTAPPGERWHLEELQ